MEEDEDQGLGEDKSIVMEEDERGLCPLDVTLAVTDVGPVVGRPRQERCLLVQSGDYVLV